MNDAYIVYNNCTMTPVYKCESFQEAFDKHCECEWFEFATESEYRELCRSH